MKKNQVVVDERPAVLEGILNASTDRLIDILQAYDVAMPPCFTPEETYWLLDAARLVLLAKRDEENEAFGGKVPPHCIVDENDIIHIVSDEELYARELRDYLNHSVAYPGLSLAVAGEGLLYHCMDMEGIVNVDDALDALYGYAEVDAVLGRDLDYPLGKSDSVILLRDHEPDTDIPGVDDED